MKNKRLWSVFAIGVTTIGAIYAAPIGSPTSGIDLNQSSITIEYQTFLDGTELEHTNFQCFGNSPLIEADSASPNYRQATVNINLDDPGVGAFFDSSSERYFFGSEDMSINIDLPTNFPDSLSCFTQAGDYSVTMNLADALGNSSSQTTNFTIYATNPTASNSTIMASDCDGKYANNDDACVVDLKLRDKFSNVVRELSGEEISVHHNLGGGQNPWEDDANLETLFFEGAKILDGTSGSYFYLNTLDGLNNATSVVGAEAAASLSFSSIAPSLQEDNNNWQTTATRSYPLNITTPTITADGSPDAGTTATFNQTAPLAFEPPVQINPEIVPGEATFSSTFAGGDGSWTFTPCVIDDECPKWNRGQEVLVKFLKNLPATINGLTSDITGTISRFIFPDDTGTDSLFTVDYEILAENNSGNQFNISPFLFDTREDYFRPFTIDRNTGTISTNEANQNKSYVEGDFNIEGEYDPDNNNANPDYNFAHYWTFVPPPDSEWLRKDADESLEIKTRATYTVDGRNVSYNAGMYSLDDNSSDLDILIEGFVVGNTSKVAAIDDLILIKVGSSEGNAAIRSNIRQNAFRMVRGAAEPANVSGGNVSFQNLDFDAQDVVVIENRDVTIDTPSGQSFDTPGQPVVPLPNGRKTLVIVDGNLQIDANLEYASNLDSFGVILVNTNPTALPTTGNIFVNNEVMSLAGTYYADGGLMTTGYNGDLDSVILDSPKQLRLTGSLLTRNTIGGSIADGNGDYVTPFRLTNSSDSNPEALAARYDLRRLRGYSPSANNINFIPGSSVDKEAAHPFILRLDRKASEFPPPGFETEQGL